MRLIDADALIKSHCLECDRYAFCNTIDECDNVAVIHASLAPTVGTVLVIQCKECKWIWTERCPDVTNRIGFDGFCSWAERIEE